MTPPGSQRERATHRAARLAALLLLDEQGALVAPDCGAVHAERLANLGVWYASKRALPRLRKLRADALAAIQRRLAE